MLRYVNDIGSHSYCKKIAISCIIMNGRKIDKMAFRDTTLNVFPRSFRGDSIGKLAFIGEHKMEPIFASKPTTERTLISSGWTWRGKVWRQNSLLRNLRLDT